MAEILSIAYSQEASSSNFNKHFSDILSTGIYYGGAVSITGANTVSIDPFILLYQCTTGEIVRVYRNTTTTVTTTETTAEYIVYSLSWINDSTNTGSFSAKSDDGNFNGNNIYANEIVFGKAVYGGGIITSIDLTNRSFPLYDTTNFNLTVKGDAQINGAVTLLDILQCGSDIILPVDSAPSSPVKGSCYFDSVTSKLYIYTGAAWISTTLAP
jgi:hypothetical protein